MSSPGQSEEGNAFDFKDIPRAMTIDEDQPLLMDPEDETGKGLMMKWQKSNSNKQQQAMSRSAATLPSKSSAFKPDAVDGAVIKSDADELEPESPDTLALDVSLKPSKSYGNIEVEDSKVTLNTFDESRARIDNFDDLA